MLLFLFLFPLLIDINWLSYDVLLGLKSWGIKELDMFDWFEGDALEHN